jgi:cupin fold WbuC family metalloprotein
MLREINGEVAFYNDQNSPNVNTHSMNILREKFEKSPRRRYRLCFHKTELETLHEMIVIYDASTYVRPNKHLGRAESLLLLEGVIDFYFFDDDGNPIRKIVMDASGDKGVKFLRVPPNTWHGMFMHEGKPCIIKETISGPYDRQTLLWAEWSPTNLLKNEVKDYYTQFDLFLNGKSKIIKDELIRVKPGIFYTSEAYPTYTNNMLDILLQECVNEKLKMARICLHTSPFDHLQEMIILLMQGSDEPSLHINTDEAITILEGAGEYNFLDNNNKIINSIPLSPYVMNNDNSFYCRINKFTRHQIKVKSDYLLFHICLNGPYDQKSTVYI